MKPLLRTSLALVGAIGAVAAPPVSEEVSIGYLPVDWVTATLRKTLSPEARYGFVSPDGPVRISDQRAKIDAARQALGELQKAPALVPIEISFATTTRREVQRLPVAPPVVDYGIPVPNRYDPPRIISHPGGGITVIPAHPRDFTTRGVGPGTVVNTAPIGYQTLTPEVRMRETVVTSNIARRFNASTVLDKPISLAVMRQSPEPAALRDLALKHRAIADNEPAWPAAGTELLITPELSSGALVVNIVPQIVVAASAPAQPRRIPLKACAAAILVARGAPTNTGILPRTDPEFYRLFLGAQPAADETVTSMTVTAKVQYVGGPPK